MKLNAMSFNGDDTHNYRIFNKGKYVGTLDDVFEEIMTNRTEFQNAFIYHAKAKPNEHRWWRADGTPYPKDQVPKEYLAMCLLVV